MFNLSKTWILIECPKCNYSFEVLIQDVVLGSCVFCHNCKCEIQLIDEAVSAKRGLKTVNNAMEELEKTLKNMFK